MTNYEKFIEIFGDVDGDVKADAAWLAQEYKGPVKLSEEAKLIKWIRHRPGLKYEIEKIDGDHVVRVQNYKGTSYIRLSDIGRAYSHGKPLCYVHWDGLTGWKTIEETKEIIMEHIAGDPFNDMFNDIFGPTMSPNRRK